MRRPIALVALTVAIAVPAVAATASTGKHSRPLIRFAGGDASDANGTAPALSAGEVCGSDEATYLTEIVDTPPTEATVQFEWADAVKGGKQIMASGVVETTHLGPADLPMSHPLGDDLSMNVDLDRAYVPFSQQLGDEQGEEKPGWMHVEISSGMIPHRDSDAVAPDDQTWRQASDADLTGFLPGFTKPKVGDRVVMMGRWIIDCGHGDYATELHPLSFLAWAQRRSDTTVARSYINPYRDTELYHPDASVMGNVDDAARLANAKPFIPFFVDELLRLLQGEIDQLRSQELLESVEAAPAPWQVCAPSSGSGDLRVRYDLVTRKGVKVKVKADAKSDCAKVVITYTDDYVPLDATMRMCRLPWDFLQEIAKDAVGAEVDVRDVVKQYVPPELAAAVDREPITACADPLQAPNVSSKPKGTKVRVDSTQPFPFYGVITVERR